MAMQESPAPFGVEKGSFAPQYGQKEIWVHAFCLFSVKQRSCVLFKGKGTYYKGCLAP